MYTLDWSSKLFFLSASEKYMDGPFKRSSYWGLGHLGFVCFSPKRPKKGQGWIFGLALNHDISWAASMGPYML